ncbi:MAG: lipoate--protein ligase [Verrucomicrobia bacterium]|nr:lipoate--protein ligase [Verrucomicrobiota bacterium]
MFRNLAVEEYLLDHVDDLAPTLFLWRSKDAVVIGKNQIPWRECCIGLIEKDGCALARRVSGGGAVYHDEGNLNYAFFVQRQGYKDAVFYQLVIDALGSLGVRAGMMGKNSIAVSGKKISGNAFALRRNAAMHHGTLLVSADLKKLGRYLKKGDDRFESHAVESISAPVTNLSELSPGITMSAVEDALIAQFGPQKEVAVSSLDQADLTARTDRYRSWEWRFGKTPKFEFTSSEGRVTVEHGLIVEGSPEFIGKRFTEPIMAAT